MQVSGTVIPPSLTWSGSVSSTWDTAAENWLNGALSAAYSEGAFLTFDDTATNTTVTSSSPVTPGSLNFSNSAKAYTFNAVGLSGAAAWSKSGTGALNVSGSNAYSDVVANAKDGLGTGSATLQGGTLTMNGYSAAANNNGKSFGTLTNALTIPAGSNGTLQVTQRGATSGNGRRRLVRLHRANQCHSDQHRHYGG